MFWVRQAVLLRSCPRRYAKKSPGRWRDGQSLRSWGSPDGGPMSEAKPMMVSNSSTTRRVITPAGFCYDRLGSLEAEMFEKFPPPIRATIEAFFNDQRFSETDDDLALDLANELDLHHPDLKIADSERIAREAVDERSAALRADR